LQVGRRICGEEEYLPALLAVAGHRLAGATRPFPGEPLDDHAWSLLVKGAYKHRLTGLLNAAAGDGALPATEAQVREARVLHRTTQVRVLGLEHELPRVVNLLAAEGIDTRVLKGCAVARLDYPDPGLRSYVDLDIMVRSRDIDRAAATLAAAGFVRTLAEPRPGFDRRFDKGMTLIPPAGYELDLHRTFVLGPWGFVIDLQQLWQDKADLQVGDDTVWALARPYRFMHASGRCGWVRCAMWPRSPDVWTI
jgi:Uncharacterised nucleotidyltransferase